MSKSIKPTLELKAIKTYAEMSEETIAFSANLYLNGKKVAKCSNMGRGGPNDAQFIGPDRVANEKAVNEAIKAMPPIYDFCDNNIDIWLGETVAKFDENKKFKKYCNKGTVVLIGDMVMRWSRHLQANDVKEILAKKYGDKPYEVVNKRFKP